MHLNMGGIDRCGFVLWIAFALAASAGAVSSSKISSFLIRVDQSGKGDFKTIQDAIDAVPSNNPDPIFIWIKPGVYREKIVIPVDKPFITLSGTMGDFSPKTIITGNDGSGIVDSAILHVMASDFVARSLTIQNTHGPGSPAVAVTVSGDRAAFYGCRFISYQDTLYDASGNHYYENCYIEGAVDFIFGNALSLFEKCHLHSIANETGYLTAQQRTSPTENTGYSFVNCKVTGLAKNYLGRPWGNYSRVVFARSSLSKTILPQGWSDWGSPSNRRTAFYAEYENTGPGSTESQRVRWSHQLSAAEAAPFMNISMIDGMDWLRDAPTRFRSFAAAKAKSHVNK